MHFQNRNFTAGSTASFQHTIDNNPSNVFEINFHKAFFETSGDFSFDIFAASFYLLSRYEEYLPHQKDQFGRYAHTNSLAFREEFLQLPLVNIWIEELRNHCYINSLICHSTQAIQMPVKL